jgi:chaperonin GroES
MNELQPVNQNVLLDITDGEKEQKTSSGIIIPDLAKNNQNIGRVVALSNVENAEIAAGDSVLYKSTGATETEFEGRKYILVQYADILAKVVKTDKI